MFRVTITKDVVVDADTVISYSFTSTALTELEATQNCIIYGSMVEFGMIADKWQPTDMLFPREQLYQFIQPSTLQVLEEMYPDTVAVAYQNAVGYVNAYLGAMFDIETMLTSGDTTSTALTLRLALIISTVTFILASSPQYSDVIDMQNRQLHTLLKGLKSGSRNFGKEAIAGEPNVRVSVVQLTKTGNRP